ncbi:MAG: acetate kinase [Elusimicrobiota bacterium]
MNVLVLNSDTSSIKFQVIETDLELIKQRQDRTLAGGFIERIGSEALITLQAPGQRKVRKAAPIRSHRDAIDYIFRWLVSADSMLEHIKSLGDIHAVGHRVVHGGENFQKSVLITKEVIESIEDCVELAPLHNPANLKGIKAAQELLGDGVPQAAVFDTAFHATMPETAYLYGIPYQLYRRHKIRRYGFHGTSHRYIAYRYRIYKKIPKNKVHIISLHLGNGCSACAIKKGESINTTMGFTPLEGLMMGTRSGDIDPSVIDYLVHKEGMTVDQVETVLNKQSGLLGVSGLTSDMRELLAEEAQNNDRRSALAIDMFCQRVRRAIGSYMAEMGGADAVVFTGGIGMNSPKIRTRVCEGLECMGIELDKKANLGVHSGKCGVISSKKSKVSLFVIPTNEELLIARDTVRVIEGVIK